MKIIIFYLLFFLNFIIQCTYAQVQPILRISSSFVQPYIYSKGCVVKVSVSFEYELERIQMSYLSLTSNFSTTNFQAYTIYPITDNSNQLIIISFIVDPLDLPMTPTIRFNTSSIDEYYDLPEVICKPIQPYNFKITNYQLIQNDKNSKNYLYVQFNFTKESGFRDIGCATDTNSTSCIVSRINIFNGSNYEVILDLSAPYQSISPKIVITFTLKYYGYNITLEIDNPFPWNETRTSILGSIETFPKKGFIFYDDYRLQKTFKRILTQFVTIENMNSIFASNSLNYLVQVNLTHSVYGSSMSFNQNLRYPTLLSYILDKSGVIINSYSAQYVPCDFTIRTNMNMESFTVNNIRFISIYSDFPYISDYDFIYFLYPFSKQIKLPRPYSSDFPFYNFKYKYIFPFSDVRMMGLSGYFYPLGINNIIDIRPNSSLPDYFFRINSINLYPLSPLTSMVNISVISNYPISIIKIEDTIANQTSLVSVFNNTYIFQFETPIFQYTVSIYIYNYQGNGIYSGEGLFYNDNFNIFYSNQVDESKFVSVSDLNYISLEKTEIDFSNGSVYNTLYLNFSKYIPNLLPYIYFDRQPENEYQGGYDFDLQLFVINFTLHPWVTDPNLFKIGDRRKLIIHSDILSNQINFEKMILKNPDGHIKPPILRNLVSFQYPGSIGWILTISDSKYGFKSGAVNMISDHDIVPYTINFTLSDRISGDKFNGVYNISFTVPQVDCRSQTYVLNTLELLDNGPNIFEYDPLSSIFGTSQEINLKIYRECTGLSDNELPNLVSIDFQPTIEVGNVNRTFEVKFITTDKDSGISKRHNPIIYLSSENTDVIQINSHLVSNNKTHFYYEATQQLPYGFGYRYLFVSVYGLVDNRLNYRSYTMLDIKNLSLPYFSLIKFNRDTPILFRSSPISNRGGSLTIYGSIMQSVYVYTNASEQPQGLNVKVDYHDGKGYQSMVPVFSSSLLIQLNNIQEINSQYLSIQLEMNGIKSNELKVYPYILFKIPTITPSPTQTPTQSICPGTPPCNNRGSCKSNGCNCNYPWYGSSCSSEIIIIPKPSPQPEPSTSVILTNSITSNVDISEIREINGNNDIIQSYKIDKWSLTDLSENYSNPTFIYKTILNSTSTNVRVSIVFYSNQTNITFGDQNLIIAPSSIKFSIEISEYQFQSPLNMLQIVIESTIKGEDDHTCSSEQIGSETGNPNGNIQWIKLNIDKISLYGRFIDFGIIDGRVTNISNRLINSSDDQTNQFRSVKVGITVPSYVNSVYLDPDFSNLIDVVDEDVDLLCKKKKKLSSGAIAGIIVGSIVFLSLVLSSILYIYKKFTSNKEQKRIEYKLKNMK